MKLSEVYKDKQPCGAYPLCNTGGILIYEAAENEDCALVTAWATGDNISDFRRHKVAYTTAGRAYIRCGRRRIYLDNVMRLEAGA